MKRLLTTCLAVSAVALAIPRAAADRDLECTLRFTSSGWSAVYQRADGSGTVTCTDGSRMPVTITAKGIGLTAGKWRIEHGTGKFTRVRRIDDIPGRYATLGGNAGLVRTGDVGVATKGGVSLALAGRGDGFDLGVAISEFRIERAGPAQTMKPKPRSADD